MVKYPFEDDAGKLVMVDLPAGAEENPDIDEWTDIDGEMLKRITIARMNQHMGVRADVQISVQPDFDVTGYSIANDHPSIERLGLKRDIDGNPLFSGIRQIEKFNADSQRMNEKDPTVQALGWE